MTTERLNLEKLFIQIIEKNNQFRNILKNEMISSLEQMDELDILKDNTYKFNIPYDVNEYKIDSVSYDYSTNEIRFDGDECAFSFEDVDTNTLKLIYDELVNTYDF